MPERLNLLENAHDRGVEMSAGRTSSPHLQHGSLVLWNSIDELRDNLSNVDVRHTFGSKTAQAQRT